MFCKYLQDIFNVPLVIQITDDKKFLYKDKDLDKYRGFALSNIKDIIAIGFDKSKTFIFRNSDYIHYLYPNVLKIQKSITLNKIYGAFGFKNTDNIGKIAFPAVQAAPAFSTSFPHLFDPTKSIPCLIPCAIDQDPYFRITRDVTKRLNHPKPCLIHSKFISALQGKTSKMSSSLDHTAIFMTDTPNQIRNKINKHAFSGGASTLEDQRKYGADPDVDIAY